MYCNSDSGILYSYTFGIINQAAASSAFKDLGTTGLINSNNPQGINIAEISYRRHIYRYVLAYMTSE